MRVGAAAGLIGAIVVGILMMTPLETLIGSINTTATGPINTAVGSLNFLVLLIVILATVALIAAVMHRTGR